MWSPPTNQIEYHVNIEVYQNINTWVQGGDKVLQVIDPCICLLNDQQG